MKQVIYPIFVLLAMVNSLTNASERQNQSPASTFRRALTSKNLPPINLWETEVFADDSNANQFERQLSSRQSGSSGYSNTDLLTFGHSCDFFGSDLVSLTDIKDLLTCGIKCSGNNLCSHFSYQTSQKKCYLKTKFGGGSKWIKADGNFMCGFIPFRACDINKANVQRLLTCLTLDFPITP